MTAHLLDTNVLIALTVAEHEHHDRSTDWLVGVDRFALCPIVEGGLVRFLLRVGERVEAAVEVLRGVHASPRCDFWPDSVSYVDVAVDHVRGHRQVTDAYLAGLAQSRGGRLATLDQGLAEAFPTIVTLVPEA